MQRPQHRPEPSLRVILRRKLVNIRVEKLGRGRGQPRSGRDVSWRARPPQVRRRNVLDSNWLNPRPIRVVDLGVGEERRVFFSENDELLEDVLLLLEVLPEGLQDGGGGFVDGPAGESVDGVLESGAEGCGWRPEGCCSCCCVHDGDCRSGC